ncbi:MAG: hypothetical protein NXI32_16555 [bacterium]|nr:hypothetical protein [bacterium]
MRPSLILGLLLLAMLPSMERLQACPFCSAVSQTLRQEMAAMDAVAIARIVPGTETDSDATFLISHVISGTELISPKQELKMNYFGKAKPEQQFLVMGVDPPDLLWSSPLPVSDIAVEYVKSIHALPESSLDRLRFYMDYLEHSESLLARDAYDEFASAPYEEIKALKPMMDREQLLAWIQDTSLPPDRKRLYLVMLGVCGEPDDAKLLEEMLRSDDPNRRAGLDAMIACYATLRGEDGLKLIDELFLTNTNSQYADTYAAIMALRFHGTDGGVIEKDRVLESMRLILDRPELADLVIPDLARWEDWTQIDKLTELFRGADEKSSWVRVPVINYLRACPLPEAAERLAELKEIDPAAYKRATSFFPLPKASAPSATDSSSTSEPAAGSPVSRMAGLATDKLSPIYSAANLPGQPVETKAVFSLPNRLSAISVMSMVSASLWISMWLSISGAGNSPLLRLFGNH